MLLYKIGYGSFSSVWLTYNIEDNKFYAMKIQTPDDYEEGLEELKIYEIISKICKQNKRRIFRYKSKYFQESDSSIHQIFAKIERLSIS
jgi:serine/threonine protein kinase